MTTFQYFKMLARWAIASKLLSWTIALIEDELSATAGKAFLTIAREMETFEINNRTKPPATGGTHDPANDCDEPLYIQQYGRAERPIVDRHVERLNNVRELMTPHCECGKPAGSCDHPVCTFGIINAARDANR